ncbi:uncharacterized protein ACWYII_010856 [Salvelinus alpinus]
MFNEVLQPSSRVRPRALVLRPPRFTRTASCPPGSRSLSSRSREKFPLEQQQMVSTVTAAQQFGRSEGKSLDLHIATETDRKGHLGGGHNQQGSGYPCRLRPPGAGYPCWLF